MTRVVKAPKERKEELLDTAMRLFAEKRVRLRIGAVGCARGGRGVGACVPLFRIKAAHV